jgi:hypothetical protein
MTARTVKMPLQFQTTPDLEQPDICLWAREVRASEAVLNLNYQLYGPEDKYVLCSREKSGRYVVVDVSRILMNLLQLGRLVSFGRSGVTAVERNGPNHKYRTFDFPPLIFKSYHISLIARYGTMP